MRTGVCAEGVSRMVSSVQTLASSPRPLGSARSFPSRYSTVLEDADLGSLTWRDRGWWTVLGGSQVAYPPPLPCLPRPARLGRLQLRLRLHSEQFTHPRGARLRSQSLSTPRNARGRVRKAGLTEGLSRPSIRQGPEAGLPSRSLIKESLAADQRAYPPLLLPFALDSATHLLQDLCALRKEARRDKEHLVQLNDTSSLPLRRPSLYLISSFLDMFPSASFLLVGAGLLSTVVQAHVA